jgi:putative redox protein
MADPKPPITAELVWVESLRFGATMGQHAVVIDGDREAGPSPMDLVAAGVAGCMAIDVVSILRKGRHPLRALRVSFAGERLPEPPRRFTTIAIHFHVTGDVPEEAVGRAVELSREKYCSAWNSLRQDITFTTAFTILRE